MIHIRSLRILAAGCLAAGIGLSAAPAGAATMGPQTFALRGTGQFKTAMASAKVTQIAKGDFKVSLTAAHLPAPAMLHVMPARHAYIAWLVNSKARTPGAMGTARLTLMVDKKTGNYTASGTVMIADVSGVIVTAEPTAMAHAPAMPEVTALSSSMAHPAM